MYQLSQAQFDCLYRIANYEGEQLLTVVSPIDVDSEATKKSLSEQKADVLDLQGLGLLRDDDEALLRIAREVSLRLERSVRVFIISEIGFKMFHGSKKRVVQ